MNWLAHLLLSKPTAAFRVGNLLPDLLPITLLRTLPAAFQDGIRQHREIDAFTDSHAVFRRSVARFNPPLRRYAGVLVDIFYDHLLTTEWSQYTDIELNNFIAEVYLAFDECRSELPPVANRILHRIREGQSLSSYGDINGVRLTLNRMTQRLRRPFDLSSATQELELQYNAFREDFREFFPTALQRFN